MEELFKNTKYIILCNGKSGSNSLIEIFSQELSLHCHNNYDWKNNLDNNLHCGLHNLIKSNKYKSNYEKLKIKCIEYNKKKNIFDFINDCSKYNENIYVISSFRYPIERKISSFFQNINQYQKNYKDISVSELINIFNKYYISNIENYDSMNEVLEFYLKKKIKNFCIDEEILKFKYKNIIFIQLHFKDIKNWHNILNKNIVNINLTYKISNSTNQKEYKNIYNNFKSQYKFPINLWNNILYNKNYSYISNYKNYMSEYFEKSNYKNFIYLFNKYILNIRNPTDEINYEIIKRCKINKKLVCHIHCYDIDKFDEIFGNYISNLKNYFSVIITFSKGDYIPSYDINILKIENRGVDIGAKICCLKYLQDENINYENMLFLHSKTDIKKRLEYFNPLIGSEDILIKNINLLHENDAIFNNIHKGYDLTPEYLSNRYYHKEILDFLGIKDTNEIEYTEGNCMFLSKKIVDFVFTNNLHLFYNILNASNDFDISWVKGRYGKHNISTEILYNDFKNNKDYMDLNKNGKAVGNNFGNISNDMPDGMIEHIFERIYINVINHLKLNYLVQIT